MASWRAVTQAQQPALVGVIVHTSPDRFPAMRQFYAQVLGLLPRSDRDGFINFEWEGVRLTLHLHDRVSGESKEPDRVLINLGVDDLDRWHHRLLENEVRCLREPSREMWGGLVATYADPDGNLVQLIQF